MSTWTSRAAPAALALAAALAVPAGVAAEVAAGAASGARAAQSLRILGGSVTAVGPPGFCVDRESLHAQDGGAAVLLASCAALGGRSAPRQPALLSLTVSGGAPRLQPLADSFGDMAAFFQSERGRATLARSGRAADLTITRISTRDGIMFLSLRDRSPPLGPAVEAAYWRAILTLRGRLVSLSVMGLAGQPLSESEGRRILDGFLARMQAANSGR